MLNHKGLQRHLLSQHNLLHSDSFLSTKLRLLQHTGGTGVFRHLAHQPLLSLPPCFSSHTDLITGPGVCCTLHRPDAFVHVWLWGSKFLHLKCSSLPSGLLWTTFPSDPRLSTISSGHIPWLSQTLWGPPLYIFIASCLSFTALCILAVVQCATFQFNIQFLCWTISSSKQEF